MVAGRVASLVSTTDSVKLGEVKPPTPERKEPNVLDFGRKCCFLHLVILRLCFDASVRTYAVKRYASMSLDLGNEATRSDVQQRLSVA